MKGAATPPWQALPLGAVTGTDWAAPEALDNADPYLAWAETDRFAGYGLGAGRGTDAEGDSAEPDWLPIVIELAGNAEVIDLVRASRTQWLQIPPVYLCQRALRFCTARAGPGFFSALRARPRLRRLVQRYELGLPMEHHTGPLKQAATAIQEPEPVPGLLSGPVLALIDGGLALAHAAFLRPDGTPRVRHFWRQDNHFGSGWPGDTARVRRPLDPARAGPTPNLMGYGHEIAGTALYAAMATHTRDGLLDEDALYHHLQLWDLFHTAHHGTHVMAQACGPTRYVDTIACESGVPDFRPRQDLASQCDLIAVQLDWSNVLDTSGGAMNVSILDGLLYILSRCADDARVVVNISWGTLAGPHDGTSILEAAMDQLIDLHDGRLEIVVPAGNGYQSRTHANATLGGADSVSSCESVTLNWRVQPGDQTQSFLELWLCDPALPEEGIRDLSITVQPPGHAQPLPPISVGQSGVWPSTREPQCGLFFPRRSALGRQGTCALLALAPTFSHHAGVTTAPFGTWRVTIQNHGLNPVVLDAFIERDDVAMGTHTGARQSYFEDSTYNTCGDLTSFIDDPMNSTPIRRTGSFNSLSSGRRTVSVGGVRHALGASDPFARYSPRMPDPDACRTQRPGAYIEPDRLAVTDDNAALWGLRGAGSRSGDARARLTGTSSASPQIARTLINTPRNRRSTNGKEAV